MTSDRKRVWGLTGGIASGKSTVARIFEELGVPVIDADEIARGLSQPGGAAHAAVLSRFGTADREKLHGIVFSDPKARGDLEAILHPLIREESARRLSALSNHALVLYEAVLSYVGVGVDPNSSSFGSMINLARSEMSRDPVVWWNLATAFTFMLGLVLAANLFADAVREAFDPRARAFRPRRRSRPAASAAGTTAAESLATEGTRT